MPTWCCPTTATRPRSTCTTAAITTASSRTPWTCGTATAPPTAARTSWRCSRTRRARATTCWCSRRTPRAPAIRRPSSRHTVPQLGRTTSALSYNSTFQATRISHYIFHVPMDNSTITLAFTPLGDWLNVPGYPLQVAMAVDRCRYPDTFERAEWRRLLSRDPVLVITPQDEAYRRMTCMRPTPTGQAGVYYVSIINYGVEEDYSLALSVRSYLSRYTNESSVILVNELPQVGVSEWPAEPRAYFRMFPYAEQSADPPRPARALGAVPLHHAAVPQRHQHQRHQGLAPRHRVAAVPSRQRHLPLLRRRARPGRPLRPLPQSVQRPQRHLRRHRALPRPRAARPRLPLLRDALPVLRARDQPVLPAGQPGGGVGQPAPLPQLRAVQRAGLVAHQQRHLPVAGQQLDEHHRPELPHPAHRRPAARPLPPFRRPVADRPWLGRLASDHEARLPPGLRGCDDPARRREAQRPAVPQRQQLPRAQSAGAAVRRAPGGPPVHDELVRRR